MSESPKWYVIHTYSGYENKVAATIEQTVQSRGFQDVIFEVRVPTETVVEVKDGKEKEVVRKIFPGYVLVYMINNEESWYLVRNTRGVTGFVGAEGTPIPLTEREVEKLGITRRQVAVNYQVGDSVMITDGPLEGFIGVVDSIDPDNDLVRVTVSMFGRETPAELQLGQAKLAE
ncbi:MAG: transcription termination/antitermination factor NusG [Oscillospiraceae bacterium]|nr:transcription termination/antitermination factor NusG [Oscillospiraceae bacterium]